MAVFSYRLKRQCATNLIICWQPGIWVPLFSQGAGLPAGADNELTLLKLVLSAARVSLANENPLTKKNDELEPGNSHRSMV